MFLIALVVVGLVCGAFALAVIHAEAVSAGWRGFWGVLQPQRLRGRGWGWLLLPLGVAFAMLDSNHPLAILTVAAGVLAPVLAPRLARKAVPWACGWRRASCASTAASRPIWSWRSGPAS